MYYHYYEYPYYHHVQPHYGIRTERYKLIHFYYDIDKWELWEKSITEEIKNVDYAFLDGTFYKNGELNRDMSEIPHPLVKKSMDLFAKLSIKDKQKVYFIHMNHTNPLLIEGSPAQKELKNNGFNIAKEGSIIRF